MTDTHYTPLAPERLEAMIDTALAHPQMPRRRSMTPVLAPAALAACLLLVFALTPATAPAPSFDAEMDDMAVAIMLDYEA